MKLRPLRKIFMPGLATIVLLLGACTQQTPMQPAKQQVPDRVNAMAKPAAGAYPQYGEKTFTYSNGVKGYGGGTMRVQNGSWFHLEDGALTPPPGTSFGDPVTVTMLIERDKFRNQLTFTFGPSGTTFEPPAEVWLDWQDLHTSAVRLYYIDDAGNYIEQQPEAIDYQGNKLKIYIDHFSRYAIGAD